MRHMYRALLVLSLVLAVFALTGCEQLAPATDLPGAQETLEATPLPEETPEETLEATPLPEETEPPEETPEATEPAEETPADATPTEEAAAEETPEAEANLVQVELTEWEIVMPTTISAGPTTFEVTNIGTVVHHFGISGQGIEEELEERLSPGESGTLMVDLAPGTYEVICPEPDHPELGMTLELTVTE